MIKRIALICLMAVGVISTTAAKSKQTRKEYIDRYKHIAIEHMEYYGIPASITMAQGILESSCGNSDLSLSSNNHFGIKCKSNWTGRKVFHDDDAKGECFRAYPSVEDSYRDHAEFLDSSPRYDSLFAYSTSDYKSWARGLKAAGYATAPHYANTLVTIIEEEKLYLLDEKDGDQKFTNQQYVDDVVVETPADDSTKIDPNNFSVTINAHKGYNIERSNGLFFTRAKAGDTIESLASTFEISKWNLRRFNDLKKDAILAEGDIIFIERKKRAWEGSEKRTHQTTEGETLYSISQKYGVKLSRVCRYNNLKKDAIIKTSQIIILR